MERFRLWSAIRNAVQTEEAPDITGGRDAEVALRERIGESFRFQGAEVFPGRRIPSRQQNRRREIDLIVCTPRQVHLIEIKNWSGRLEVRGGDWIQERRGGGVVNHHDLLAENLLKRSATLEYLNDRGLKLDEAFAATHLSPVIMFMNPNLEIEPRIEALPEVFSRRELDAYLKEQPRKTFSEGLLASMIAYCFSKEGNGGGGSGPKPIETKLYQEIVRCLAEAPTWDQVGFHGSKTITGDLISLKLGHQILRREQIAEIASGRPILLRWTKNTVLGWLKVLTGLGSLGSLRIGKTSFKLELNDTVMFHDVGERESTTRRLVGIDRLVLG